MEKYERYKDRLIDEKGLFLKYEKNCIEILQLKHKKALEQDLYVVAEYFDSRIKTIKRQANNKK